MAWETRKGRRYYYGKVREGSKVRSVYLGRGAEGATVAEMVEDARFKLALAKEREGSEEALLGDSVALYQQTMATVARALEGSGFHRHRGEWRKLRNG